MAIAMTIKSAVKPSDITVEMNDDGVAQFGAGSRLWLLGNYSKDTQSKSNKESINIGFWLDLTGVDIEDVLEPFGVATKIRMQTIRNRDDFVETAQRLQGATVHFDDIDEWTQRDAIRGPLTPEQKKARAMKAGANVIDDMTPAEAAAYVANLQAKAMAKARLESGKTD